MMKGKTILTSFLFLIASVAHPFASEKTTATPSEIMQVDLAADLRPLNSIAQQPVLNTDGKMIGQISGLMVELNSGKLAYALVTLGGGEGLTGKVHPIPWKALTPDEVQNAWILDLAEERMSAAPVGDEKLGDPDIGRKIHEFYGVAPFWEEP